jgi:hypothetical protein
MARTETLADAFVAALNAQEFSLEFEATREVTPTYDIEKESALKVQVVPSGQKTSRGTRGLKDANIVIDIGVQKLLSKDRDGDKDALDPLMALVQEIGDFVLGVEIGDCSILEVDNTPIYDQDAILEHRLFMSVQRVTCRDLV